MGYYAVYGKSITRLRFGVAAVMSRRALTQPALRNQALHYLARYAASPSRVEAVLTRRLAAARAEGGAEAEPEDIPPLLDRLEALGLIDDRAYAETKARSLARRGFSSRALALQLGGQGLARPLVDAAIRELGPGLDSDLVRGWRYAGGAGWVPSGHLTSALSAARATWRPCSGAASRWRSRWASSMPRRRRKST